MTVRTNENGDFRCLFVKPSDTVYFRFTMRADRINYFVHDKAPSLNFLAVSVLLKSFFYSKYLWQADAKIGLKRS
jgi:hypothetical protein